MIDKILGYARSLGCSDVHISEGLPVIGRLNGTLVTLPFSLTDGEARGIFESLIGGKKPYAGYADYDLSYESVQAARCRVNIYKYRQGYAAAIRLLAERIPSFSDLGLPEVVAQLAEEPRGLILVTGPTGSGKSTTIASMINYISKTRSCHVVTIENPVEYVLPQNCSMVHQREVGDDAYSFASALRSALREDPDVIFVGEMRDYETISIAITAAETGHLVLSTLHTVGAAHTIDRIVDTCPAQGQSQMRGQLAAILRSVITQQLLPAASGNGRVVATEILVGTDAVSNLIRENKCYQLESVMQSGAREGMHTLNGNLASLVKRGLIAEATAESVSFNKADLRQYLKA